MSLNVQTDTQNDYRNTLLAHVFILIQVKQQHKNWKSRDGTAGPKSTQTRAVEITDEVHSYIFFSSYSVSMKAM